MNTVDALKKLYKTLAGKDYAGDPNPTDAEMIDAIAKDATSGGSGGGDADDNIFEVAFTTYTPGGQSPDQAYYFGINFESILAAAEAGKLFKLTYTETTTVSGGSMDVDRAIIAAPAIVTKHYPDSDAVFVTCSWANQNVAHKEQLYTCEFSSRHPAHALITYVTISG